MGKIKAKKFYKQHILRVYGYLALIPFYFAFMGLKENFTISGAIILSIGVLIVLVITIVNHFEPVVKITEDRIIMYNILNNKPRVRFIYDYVGFTSVSSYKLILNFDDDSYEVKLNHRDCKKLKYYLGELR